MMLQGLNFRQYIKNKKYKIICIKESVIINIFNYFRDKISSDTIGLKNILYTDISAVNIFCFCFEKRNSYNWGNQTFRGEDLEKT